VKDEKVQALLRVVLEIFTFLLIYGRQLAVKEFTLKVALRIL